MTTIPKIFLHLPQAKADFCKVLALAQGNQVKNGIWG